MKNKISHKQHKNNIPELHFSPSWSKKNSSPYKMDTNYVVSDNFTDESSLSESKFNSKNGENSNNNE